MNDEIKALTDEHLAIIAAIVQQNPTVTIHIKIEGGEVINISYTTTTSVYEKEE